jgi:hypothetical protein
VLPRKIQGIGKKNSNLSAMMIAASGHARPAAIAIGARIS